MAGTVGLLAQRMGSGSGLLTAWVGLPDPLAAGVLAREGFDTVTLDMQHGSIDFADVVLSIGQVALAGKPAIVRIPVDAFPIASRALDAGAAAVIAPMVNSAEDARRFASFMKFPPLGERSWGPHMALSLTGLDAPRYLAEANGITRSIAMVETREAMAALDDILATPGIDAVFVGPSDLSIALSDGAHVDASHPDVNKALDHVVRRCRAHGKAACAFAHSGERALEMRRRGFDLIACGTDILQLRTGARQMLEAAGPWRPSAKPARAAKAAARPSQKAKGGARPKPRARA
jgi:4-hydroxy-2-oxoheptanedioate aldolase